MKPSNTPNGEVRLLVNPKTKKVACVLMQAAYGYGAGNWIVSRFFDSRAWDTGEGMSDYRLASFTVEDWKKVAEKMNGIHAKKPLYGR